MQNELRARQAPLAVLRPGRCRGRLDERTRKTFGFETLAERFNACVARGRSPGSDRVTASRCLRVYFMRLFLRRGYPRNRAQSINTRNPVPTGPLPACGHGAACAQEAKKLALQLAFSIAESLVSLPPLCSPYVVGLTNIVAMPMEASVRLR